MTIDVGVGSSRTNYGVFACHTKNAGHWSNLWTMISPWFKPYEKDDTKEERAYACYQSISGDKKNGHLDFQMLLTICKSEEKHMKQNNLSQ